MRASGSALAAGWCCTCCTECRFAPAQLHSNMQYSSSSSHSACITTSGTQHADYGVQHLCRIVMRWQLLGQANNILRDTLASAVIGSITMPDTRALLDVIIESSVQDSLPAMTHQRLSDALRLRSANIETEQHHRSGLHSNELSAWHLLELRTAQLIAKPPQALALACMPLKPPDLTMHDTGKHAKPVPG